MAIILRAVRIFLLYQNPSCGWEYTVSEAELSVRKEIQPRGKDRQMLFSAMATDERREKEMEVLSSFL